VRPAVLGGADIFGLVAAALVCAYLVYALLRGERL
jgi:F subunit of K+-transporting ATPase (Potass_KdpF)